MELIIKQSEISQESAPGWKGTVHALMCPLLDKELEKELLCGMDPKYSKSTLVISTVTQSVFPVNLFCIELMLDNMLKDVNGHYIRHGKCFMNAPDQVEVFFDHKIEVKETKDLTMIKASANGEIFYESDLPGLEVENAYETFELPEEDFITGTHINYFEHFYSKQVGEWCPAKPQGASLMTVNFGQTNKFFTRKLENLDHVFVSDKMASLFGLKNPLNKDSFDASNCVTTFVHDIKLMDNYNVIAVDRGTSIPLNKDTVSHATTANLPMPFDKMGREIIRNMTVLTEVQRHNKFDLNNALMDKFYDRKLN